MRSIVSSRKGMESAPFFLIVSSIIIVITLSIVMPAISAWNVKMNDALAMRETQKLRDAINEMSSMGDVGSVEKIVMNLPPGYYIQVSETQLSMYRKANLDGTLSMEDLLKLQLDAKASPQINSESDDPNEIFGHMVIELRYGKAEEGKFVIFVT